METEKGILQCVLPFLYDGKFIAPDGNVVASDGKIIAPDGKSIASDGKFTAPNGNSVAPDGNYIAPLRIWLTCLRDHVCFAFRHTHFF